MDSNTHEIYYQNHHPSSGLLRFRSAPSSLLANFTENGIVEKTGGFESDRLISRFISSNDVNCDLGSPSLREFDDKSLVKVTDAAVTYAATSQNQQQSHSGKPPHYPRPNSAVSSSAMDGSYQFLAMSNHGKSLDSNRVRQSSSPAGLFTNLSVQNGYGLMKNMLSYGPDEELSPSSNGLKRHCNLASRPPSSLGMLSEISEIGSENLASGFQYGHWNDPSSFVEKFSGVKRELDIEGKLFSGPQDIKNGESGNCVGFLSHHSSLPKTSSDMVATEKFLWFQDSVPCKIRAKRGCATHPRSIAERVRRTRISERMRKLQELVPNMDKQTNTADMLDFAVEYIKDLQRQFKTLSDNRANCKCMNTEKKPIQNQMV